MITIVFHLLLAFGACHTRLRTPASMLGALGAILAILPGCQPGGVGDPCIPEPEYRQDFGAFDMREVYVESRSFQCETRLCLINHFQGRVTCPYGQQAGAMTLPADAPERCRIPGTAGSRESDAVAVPVKAWNTSRPAPTAVYCSCRCDGPDRNARYCTCPEGYVCTSLIPPWNLSREQLRGSYCVKEGTEYRETDRAHPSCRKVPDDPACPG